MRAVLNTEGPREFVGITDMEGNLSPETEEALMGEHKVEKIPVREELSGEEKSS